MDQWTDWLRQGLARGGRTQRGLALALGVDASAVSRLLHGRRRLRAHEIPVAARYLGLDPVDPLAPASGAVRSPPIGTSDWLPLLGLTAGSAPNLDEELFQFNDAAPIDHVRRPDGLIARPRAFALQVIGSSMAPRHEPGDVIAVDPDQPVAIGADVVVALSPAYPSGGDASDGGAGRRLLLKRLVHRSAGLVRLAQFNPPRDDIALSPSQISALWPVLPLKAVLGL